MKLRKLTLLSFLSAALVVACNGNGGGKGGDNPPQPSRIESFEEAVASVLNKHNYSAHVKNQFNGESEPFVEFNYYNINDDVMFDDLSGYYSGYIKQKNQGIVTFRAPFDNSGIVVGRFVATNTQLDISDYYTLALEHILDKEFTKGENDIFTCTDFDAMAVIGGLAFGDYVTLTSAPENFTAKFENDKLTISAVFGVDFFDEQPLHFDASISIEVTKLESTKNTLMEKYVKNPDYTYKAPTDWDNGVKEYFDENYNGYYPPFIEGLSYSWDYGSSVSEGSYVVMVEDYYSGDLTSRYATILADNGFVTVSNPAYIEYVKTVEDEQLVHKYSVKMKFYAPTDTDGNGMQYGYLYPNGVSSFKFLHKQQTKDEIVNVGLLNTYIASTQAGGFLPTLGLDDTVRVSGFKDATDSDPIILAFLGKGKSNDYFNIYPTSKQTAVNAFNAFKSDLESKGFESSTIFGQVWMSDDYGSAVRFTDPSGISDWTSSTYIQMRISITKATIEAYEEPVVTMESLSVSGQTTTFNVGDTFVFDGSAVVTYSNGHTETVTPTEIVEPDMTSAGQKTVVVKYTNADGDTVSTDYVITVNALEVEYSITLNNCTGATIRITYPEGATSSSAGKAINFMVDLSDGYVLTNLSVTSNGQPVDVSGPSIYTGAYQFIMPAGDVSITVSASQSTAMHSITYVIWDAASYENLNYNDVISTTSTLPTTAPENSVVDFSVVTKTGYLFVFAGIEDDSFDTTSFSYQMGTSNLEVNIFVVADEQGGGGEGGEGGESTELSGTYSWYKGKMAGYDTYFRITFNDDGTGTYVRDPASGGSGTNTISFTYTVKDNAITLTLTDVGQGFSNFSTYRPFASDTIGTTNKTGVINNDGSISLTVYGSSGASPSTQTFTK